MGWRVTGQLGLGWVGLESDWGVGLGWDGE